LREAMGLGRGDEHADDGGGLTSRIERGHEAVEAERNREEGDLARGVATEDVVLKVMGEDGALQRNEENEADRGREQEPPRTVRDQKAQVGENRVLLFRRGS